MIVGNTNTSAGFRALLWQDGAVEDLGLAPGAKQSLAHAINIHNQVVGFASLADGRSQAMRWRNGKMTLLRKLAKDQASDASGINAFGVIVGGVTVLQPEYRETAVNWLGCHVTEIHKLVSAGDPPKQYVHLRTASRINNRGDIVASGYDSRRPNVLSAYFLTLSASEPPSP